MPTVGYQWKLNTNTVLTGATGTTLSLANIRASQSGSCYCVVVTNGAGSMTSSIAKLVVTNPLPSAFNSTASVKPGSAFQFTFIPVAVSNQQQPGPVFGRVVDAGVGAVAGKLAGAGAGVGVVEGTIGGMHSAFDNTQARVSESKMEN